MIQHIIFAHRIIIETITLVYWQPPTFLIFDKMFDPKHNGDDKFILDDTFVEYSLSCNILCCFICCTVCQA